MIVEQKSSQALVPNKTGNFMENRNMMSAFYI